MLLACLAILALLLLIGAAIDIRSRRIPNWLTAGVAGLYVFYALTAPDPVDWLGASAIAGTSFIVGFALFAFNLMGGGDVKLISGLALWAGVDLIALFLLVTGLAGGVMSLCVLLFRRFTQHPFLIAIWPMASVTIANRLGITFPASGFGRDAQSQKEDPTAGSLPYGVAIAAGGFVVISALLNL